MKENFLFAKLFFLVILLNISENYAAYRPPAATVQPLHPRGLRISIPDEHGITLVAFHVKFNEDFDGLEAGHIAKDILKVRNGKWIYEDRRTVINRDDIIYYWVHVVYEGLGYNLIDQSYRVKDFYTYDGTLYVEPTVESPQPCTTNSSTLIFENNEERQVCSNQLIFEDNFDNINTIKWNPLNSFSGPPDSEFVVYITDKVTDTRDGRLRITPTLLNTQYSDNNFISRGQLTLENCTEINTEYCQRQAIGSYILPPVISGRINTKGKFEFLYGRVEIKAKLPHGDWVYPLITLENAETLQSGLHREIRIASSAGNEELKKQNNDDISGHILSAGGLITSSTNTQSNRRELPKRVSGKTWSDDFHIFEIEWKNGVVRAKVDGVHYGDQTVDLSFGKKSYLTLGVAVGGVHEFPDHSTSSGYAKPWRNNAAKALYNFYRAEDKWHRTWNDKTMLQVDYVKVWAL